jgi:hypothetical protein
MSREWEQEIDWMTQEAKDRMLHKAAASGDLEKVKVLLEKGANPEDNNASAMRHANWYDHQDIVQILAKHCTAKGLKRLRDMIPGNIQPPAIFPPIPQKALNKELAQRTFAGLRKKGKPLEI